MEAKDKIARVQRGRARAGTKAGQAHLSTLNFRYEARVLQFHPVSLVQLWTNQEVEVLDLVILTNKCSSETQLCMSLNSFRTQ